MSLRKNLSSSYKKGGLSDGEIHPPSRAYERYFEGYLESAEPVPNQRRAKAVRAYTAQFYMRELSEKQDLRLRLLFAALYILALPLMLFSAARDIPANRLWYVTLPQAASLLALVWTAIGLFHFCAAPQKMTVRQYREGVVSFRRAAGLAAACLGALSLAYLLCAVLRPEGRAGSLWSALRCMGSFGCVLAVFLIGGRVRYTEQSNPLAGE